MIEPLPAPEKRIAAWESGRDARNSGKTAYDNPYSDDEITLARLWIDGYCNMVAPDDRG